MPINNGVKIVVIGGGTGSFSVLNGLKSYTTCATALVSMADDGGSTGVLRDELGALPPGDVRQCLVALSRSSETMRELFMYRFPKNSFAQGHSFGNLFLSTLEKITGSFAEAVGVASEVLNIAGRVVPITLDNTNLTLKTENGTVISSQSMINMSSFDGQKSELSLQPKAIINPDAAQAIADADMVVLAPGDLYTSLAPALLVKGVSKALINTKAKVIYVCNLVTSRGQTDGFYVHDFANEIERFIDNPRLDYVLFNTDHPSKTLLNRYAKDGEYGVKINKQQLKKAHYQAIGANLLSPRVQKTDPSDVLLARTFIRHDSDKVARQIMKLHFE